MVMSAGCALRIDHHAASVRGEFTVGAKDRLRFAITACSRHDLPLKALLPRTIDARIESTKIWWQSFTRKSRRVGINDPTELRSALTLKLLTCGPTGAIVAAATTSLPEAIGGQRNWDYRYSWIRDATMALYAMFTVGHPEVATGFKRFIETATAGRPEKLQIMYGCYGERRLTEHVIDGLSGYRDSRPVRVGNGAATQSQLDVYGELLGAANLWRLAGSEMTDDGWRSIKGLVDLACVRWREPDHGLWEMRGELQHFVYSKAMCWLAVSRGIALAEAQGVHEEIDRWRAVRDEIHQSIDTHGIDPKRGCYVQSYGSTALDASLLRLPILGFIPIDEPRAQATIAAVREDLSVGSLLRRYRPEETDDGVSGGEGSFLMASFWLVDVLVMSGKLDEAESLYRELTALSNDVGLFAEQYDAVAQEQLGNFPQAFTHISQIMAAEQIRRCRAGGDRTAPIAMRLGSIAAAATQHHTASKRTRR